MSVKAALDVKPVIENGFWLNEWLYNAKGMVALVLGQFADPPSGSYLDFRCGGRRSS